MKTTSKFKSITATILSLLVTMMTLVTAYPVQASAASDVTIQPGTYTLTSGLSDSKGSLAIDVAKAAKTDKTNVIVYTANYNSNQKFKIESRGSGWYSLIDTNSGLALTVANGKKASNVNVQVEKYTGSSSQLFRFESAGSGFYYIQNKLGYYLDVSGGKKISGSNLIVYKQNKTKGQKWRLNGYVSKNKVLYVAGSCLEDYKIGSSFTTSKKYYYYVHKKLTNLGGSQCYAYARYVQQACFGKYDQTTVASNITTADSLKKSVMAAGVGAHIRVPRNGYQHSVVVIGIDSKGMTIADANGTAGKNKVGTKYYTYSNFLSSWCIGGKVLWIKQSY